MSNNNNCAQCESEFTYPEQDHMVCSQCFCEWNLQAEEIETNVIDKVLDANGNELVDETLLF